MADALLSGFLIGIERHPKIALAQPVMRDAWKSAHSIHTCADCGAMYASKKHDQFLEKVKTKLVRPDACSTAAVHQHTYVAALTTSLWILSCYSTQHPRIWPGLRGPALIAPDPPHCAMHTS